MSFTWATDKAQPERMATKQQQVSNFRRAVYELLGENCVDCASSWELQCDLIISDGGVHHGLSHVDRWRFYWRQAQAGNLALRCPECHKKKTRRDFVAARAKKLAGGFTPEERVALASEPR
jgi:hypothetical protein